jgi:hypothetical protein
MTSAVPRFEVRVEEGAAHGGLFEYEQTTYYHVVDLRSNEVVMTFESETTASLSTGGGHWTDHNHTGVSHVSLAPDQRSVRVQYRDGWEASVALPE